MPRHCSICDHPERDAIDRALVDRAGLRDIARQFRVSKDAVARHKTDHLPASLTKAEEAKEVARADSLTAELKRIAVRINLLFDACDRWLRDPEHPERYEIGPRAEDVTVTYLEPTEEGKGLRKKAKLSALLPKAESQGLTVELVEVKHADPRELILKTSQRLEGQLELLARLMGELKETTTVNVLVLPEWQRIRTTLLEALLPYPEARIAVAAALKRIDG